MELEAYIQSLGLGIESYSQSATQFHDEANQSFNIPISTIIKLKEACRELETSKVVAKSLNWSHLLRVISLLWEKDVSLELMKLLANCLRQVPSISVQIVHNESLKQLTTSVFEVRAPKVLSLISTFNDDLERRVVFMRFLFILLSTQTDDICLDMRQVRTQLIQMLKKMWTLNSSPSNNSQDNEMVLTEILRLLFPISKRSYLKEEDEQKNLLLVIEIWASSLNNNPNSPLRWHATNALLSFNLQLLSLDQAIYVSEIACQTLQSILISREVEYLEKGLNLYFDIAAKYQNTLPPILAILLSLLSFFNIKQNLSMLLFPTNDDRKQSLQKGKSFRCLLLRLLTIPIVEPIGTYYASLLNELCDGDSQQIARIFGAGYAMGISQHSETMPFPSPLSKAASPVFQKNSRGQENTEENNLAIDPITGSMCTNRNKSQRLELSQEEKEREAERLFYLFQRLEKNSTIQVTNPIQQAVNSGLYEKLDDNDSD
ncbi:Synembryn-like protein C3E7.04c [Schizosaccharomyces pombe]